MDIIEVAKKKASQSHCHFKVSAIGLDRSGKIIGTSVNSHGMFPKKGGGLHAEINLINRYGRKLDTILICRVNKTGGLLPIEACPNCKKRAEKHNIKIKSVIELIEK